MKRLSLITALLFFISSTVFAQSGTFAPIVTSSDHLSLSGTGSSYGYDFNGNGLYDYLIIGVGTNADYAGYYAYSVDLTDKNGHLLGSQASYTFINSGSSVFNVFFDGTAIGANGVNGPYYLRNLTLQNMFGLGSLVAPLAFQTQAFLASQFEAFRGDTEPPTVTVSASPRVLWPADHKMHEIKVTMNATDNMDANPSVVLQSITSNQGQNMIGDGNTPSDILVQGGKIYLRAERTGTITDDRMYVITYSAKDSSGNIGTGFATVKVPHNQ